MIARRRLAKFSSLSLSLAMSLALASSTAGPSSAQQQQPPPCPYAKTPTQSPDCHPYPQPPLRPSAVTTNGDTTVISTGESLFARPAVDPFTKPPGTNFLPTVYTNMFDSSGVEMLNTLPSTPTNPYNLHEGDPIVTEINSASPTDDLRAVFETVTRLSNKEWKEAAEVEAIAKAIGRGLDILEGNPIPERAYSGLPLLHYTGPEKVKKVTPILDAAGRTIGGNVDIHQIWYDSHIESDTAFVDPSAVMNVPWTVTYTVDVLSRGGDDFSPFVMYVDPPTKAGGMPMPHIGMDQSFFPMEDGTRTVFKIKMAPGKYFNLTYTWGWRYHPPRAQVFENALKKASAGGVSRTLVEWEQSVFCPPENQQCAPRSSEALKLRAIGMIGDIAPEKVMWTALRAAREAARRNNYREVVSKIQEARASFDDWRDRTRLPRAGKHKVEADREADLTLLYVNNTIYAEFADRSENIADSVRIDWPEWKMRGAALKVTMYNGDHFVHGYQNVDFGGGRGWENQFKSSVRVGGSGCWFTFGRAHWWMNIPNDAAGNLGVVVPAAERPAYKLGMHKVQLTFNYEPSRRLRFYQFDPLHHDVAILSIH